MQVFGVEALEGRTLLAAIGVQPIANQVFGQDSGSEQAYLYGVFTDNNTALQDLAFSATSSDPSVVTASVSGAIVTITPVAGRSGFARVQLNAVSPSGSSASDSFRVQITASDNRALDVLLGAGSPTSVRYVQSNGGAATVSLSGPGSAVLHFGGDNLVRAGTSVKGSNAELESATLSDTTGATVLRVTGERSHGVLPLFGNVSAPGSLGQLAVKNAVLEGNVAVDGALASINVDYAANGTITVGSGTASIVGKSFQDENFSSASGVRGVKLLQWTTSDSADEVFSAASVGSINVRSDFTPGLQLSGAGVTGRTLGSVHIPGTISGVWNVSGTSAPLSVGNANLAFNGTFDGLPSFTSKMNLSGQLNVTSIQSIRARYINLARVTATGDIGSVAARSITYSSVLAGVSDLYIRQLPSSPSDFVAAGSVKSVRIAGGTSSNFIYSVIAASSLGAIGLGRVTTANNGIMFGIAAADIGRLQFVAGKKQITLDAVHDAATLASQLTAQNASLGDMTVEILQ